MNNYLSFEQLKNLSEGDWVWVVNKKEEREEYAVIRRGPKCFGCPLELYFPKSEIIYAPREFDTYGKNWFAYKNKEQANGETLSKELKTKLLRCIVFKSKHHNYFEPFHTQDAFGTPQVMSMDELLIRTTIDLLGVKSLADAEEQLKELKEGR